MLLKNGQGVGIHTSRGKEAGEKAAAADDGEDTDGEEDEMTEGERLLAPFMSPEIEEIQAKVRAGQKMNYANYMTLLKLSRGSSRERKAGRA